MDLTSNIANLSIEDRTSTSTSTPILPDEVWLRIIYHLNVMDPVDVKAIEALGSTSRRFRDMTCDQQNIREMLEDQEIAERKFFEGTIWTPRTLGRLSAITNQSRWFLKEIWYMWLVGFQSPDLPIIHQAILNRGLWAAIKINGLETPDYTQVTRFSQALNVSMLAAALIFQEVFLNQYHIIIPGREPQWVLDVVRRALRYVFLTKGPMVCSRILEYPSRPDPRLEATITPMMRAICRPGQKIIFTNYHDAGGPVASWTLENAIVHERRSGWVQPPFAHRIDKRVEARMAAITNGWIASGHSDEYLGREEYKKDLVGCLAAWQTGNSLL